MLVIGNSLCHACQDSGQTWDNGKPISDCELDHINDVFLGGD